MREIAVVIFAIALGCRPGATTIAPQQASQVLLSDSFDDLAVTARYWAADLPRAVGATVQSGRYESNSFMSLTLPSGQDAQELVIHRSVNLTGVHGQRVRLSARIQARRPDNASGHVRLSMLPPAGVQTYSDFADGSSVSADSWTTTYAVVDVPPTATRGDVALAVNGTGTVWFDDVRVVSLGPSPVPRATRLPAFVNERLVTLARALSLVRYFHPSDQSAAVDWNAFSIQAIEHVLRSSETSSMRELLERVFAGVAPTIRFVKQGDQPQLTVPRDPSATHLVRWHHVGLGSESSGSLYRSFRDGIDADESAGTHVRAVANIPHLATCHSAEIRATVHAVTGAAWLFVKLSQSANRTSYIRQKVEAAQGLDVVIARGEVPADVQQVQLGIYLDGRSSIEFSDIALKCEDGQAGSVDAHSAWEFSQYQDLFRKEVTTCGTATCLSVRRMQPDTEFRPDRDIADMDIGSGLRLVLPLAVWSDGKATFPRVPALELPPPDHAIADLPVRLAAVATTWSTLLWFYPYFGDQRIDWPAVLPRALDDAAAARSPEETHAVLSRLVAGLRDGHARVRHPTQSVLGMLPLALRKFGDKIIIVGGLLEYMLSIPAGSELVAVDGIPASKLYASNYVTVSAATPGFRDYLASLYISLGAIGAFKHVRWRPPTGPEVDSLLPLVSRQLFDEDIHVNHPRSGAEVAPGILYVDPMKLDRTTLPALVQSLTSARAVIVDLRGYIKSVVYELLAHFISQAVHSPEFRAPIVSVLPGGGSQDEGWLLWPAAPLLSCRMIVLTDARAVSAAETMLQIIRDNHLATLVGEPTAGTNGDVNTFLVPGGFEVRFTGLRTSGPDGSTIQGHGITPDQIVHPTLEGVRAGRDEILEAGIAIAQRLAAP